MSGEHTTEMVGAAAGLHPDHTLGEALRQSDQRLPSHLTPHHDRTAIVEHDHAADVLAKIDARARLPSKPFPTPPAEPPATLRRRKEGRAIP